MTARSQSAEQVPPPLANTNRREFLVSGALGSAALLAGMVRLLSNEVASSKRWPLEQLVPERIGAWSNAARGDQSIPVGEGPDGEAYDGLLTRYYSGDQGGTIMFLIAYGNAQTGNAQLHRPESCYPAAGFNLHSQSQTSLPAPGTVVPARAMTAEAPGRIEQILYWSRIGDRFPTNSAGQRWVAFRQALDGSTPDGALVRISTIHPDQAIALPALKSFASALLATPSPSLRELLTGRR